MGGGGGCRDESQPGPRASGPGLMVVWCMRPPASVCTYPVHTSALCVSHVDQSMHGSESNGGDIQIPLMTDHFPSFAMHAFAFFWEWLAQLWCMRSWEFWGRGSGRVRSVLLCQGHCVCGNPFFGMHLGQAVLLSCGFSFPVWEFMQNRP